MEDSEVSAKHINAGRDRFSNKFGFILACIGSAVGMGNIWRFPSMVSRYGGLTFLIPYFVFVIIIGLSGVLGEFALGRMTGAGPIGAFGACTKMRGKELPGKISGIIPVLGSLALAIGYTVVVGWIFKYTFVSITGQLGSLGSTPAELGATFDQIAATSPSFGESVKAIFTGKTGNTLWLIIGLVVSIVIMIFGIGGGIEKVNKFMMPTLFVLLIGLGIYIACLPGAGEGYRYIFAMKSEMLLDPELWVFAFGQAFFSLSVAGNGSVIYGSYLPKDEDLVFSSRNIALFDTIAALLAAFVIIPAMTAGNGDPTQGGPGLMFIALVQVFNNMPGGAFTTASIFSAVVGAQLSESGETPAL